MKIATDIDALCAAIDAGDDSALPILADALEEAGDARHAGLRRVPLTPRKECDGRYVWWADHRGTDWDTRIVRDAIPRAVWERLEGGEETCRNHSPPGMSFPTRSAAYLALAEALS